MAEAATRALRDLLAQGEVAIYNIGADKYQGRVVAERTMCRPRWSRPVTGAATAAAIVAAGARPPVADSQNEKAAHAARLSNSNPVRAAQCVTVTVVPMETR